MSRFYNENEIKGEEDKITDPLLKDQDSFNKYVLFPIPEFAKDIWSMYKKAFASFWSPEEIDLSSDYLDFKELKPPEQHFILTVLAFFAAR